MTYTDATQIIFDCVFPLASRHVAPAAEQAAPQEVHGVHTSPVHEIAIPAEGFERQLRANFHARAIILETWLPQ